MRFWNIIDGGWLLGRPRLLWAHFVKCGTRRRHVTFKCTRRARERAARRKFIRGTD